MKTVLLILGLLVFPLHSQATTYYGVNADITQVDNPPGKIPARENHGRLRTAYDEVTYSAALTGLDVIRLMKLPKGAKVYDVLVLSDELDAGINTSGLSLGVEANGSGIQTANSQLFMSQADVSGNDLEYRLADNQTVAGNGTTLLAETQLVLTPHSNLPHAAGRKTKVWVYYSTE